MSRFSNALQRSRSSLSASAIILALAALAITVPGTIRGDNGKGNAYGQNKGLPLRRQPAE